MRKKILAPITIALGLIFLFTYFSTIETFDAVLYELYVEQAQARTGALNIVTAIYLDYRIFDTLLEALLLLTSVVAIFQFIKLESFEDNLGEWSCYGEDCSQSEIQRYIISIIYPILIIFGIYIIANGADSPGGGFQGGAVLSAIMMSRYLVVPTETYDYKVPYFIEKIFFLSILLTATLFTFGALDFISNRTYMLLANMLIGAKVAFGMTSIFLRFIYFGKEEDDEQL